MNTQRTPTDAASAVVGGVRNLLRLEALCVLALSVYAYSKFGNGWMVFLACFFIPDLSFLGYLAGSRAGALLYNAAHSYLGPAVCFALSLGLTSHALLGAALIWSSHVGFDRMLGYGLKYSGGFSLTHLGAIGRRATDK